MFAWFCTDLWWYIMTWWSESYIIKELPDMCLFLDLCLLYFSSLTYLITFEASNPITIFHFFWHTQNQIWQKKNNWSWTEYLPKSWKSLYHNRCFTYPRCEPTGHWRGGVCRGRGGLCEAVCVVRIPPAGSGCRGAACEAAPRLRGRACSPGPPPPALCLDWSASW